MSILLIYFEFFKIGLFAVGGGLATLPFLFRMADTYDWLTREMVGNFLAIGQSLPGPIGTNMAVQVGYQYAGIPGSVFAILGQISPAIILITLIARVINSFKENKIVASVFQGVRPAAAGLLGAAGLATMQLALYNANFTSWQEILRYKECFIFAILLVMIYKLKGHPIIYIAIGATAGIVFGL